MARHRPERTSLPKAIREGTIKIGDLEIRCAVLEDGRRLLTQSDVMLALGRARQVKSRLYFDADVNNLVLDVSSDIIHLDDDVIEVVAANPVEYIRAHCQVLLQCLLVHARCTIVVI